MPDSLTPEAMGARNRRDSKKPASLGRVLLVDDQEPLSAILAAFLVQEGYEVVQARTGRQARRLLAKDRFHAIVTDSMLPDISGWEVAVAARKQGTPVVLSSGWPIRLGPAQLASRGVDFLCPKPCSPRELQSVIRRAMRKRKATKAGT
jgi:DNA-binding response OmpR family regulator